MVSLRLELPPLEAVSSEKPLPPVSRTIEPIGWLYECMLAHGKAEPVASPTKAASQPHSPTLNLGNAQQGRGKAVRLEKSEMETDWYEVLKLPNGEDSTDDEIRAQHKKRCLETHPDKQPGHSDVEFKKVQRALDILINPDARRAYDSSLPFDDAIPGDDVTEEAFFGAFAAVFKRNARFSLQKPVPELGNDDADIKDVKKFYDFWLSFRSWRDFSHEVELERIDEGMSREEKRYYQRENQRQVDKLKKEEVKRVRTLVDRAMKVDPRLRRQREAEEAARQKAKEEKEAAKAAQAAEARRIKALARGEVPQAKADDKKAAVDPKAQKRITMKEVTEFFKANGLLDPVATNLLLAGKVRQPNISWMAQNASVEEVQGCRDAVTAAATAAVSEEIGVPACLVFNYYVDAVEKRLGRNRYGEGMSKSGRAPTEMPPPFEVPSA